MNGLDGITGWKNLKQRLSFKGLGCCGATWSSRASTVTILEDDDVGEEQEPIIHDRASDSVTVVSRVGGQVQVDHTNVNVVASGMNLGMALLAERNFRSENMGPTKHTGPQQLKTLMRLIEETDGVDWRKFNNSRKKVNENGGKNENNEWVCCVCMERSKGAAFIPCGHTFCRVCSKELWANRGSCPICNRSILEILDIF